MSDKMAGSTPADSSGPASGNSSPGSAVSSSGPLPPGRGSPIVPGPPQSVQPAIPARTINMTALIWLGAAAVLALLLILLGASLLQPK